MSAESDIHTQKGDSNPKSKEIHIAHPPVERDGGSPSASSPRRREKARLAILSSQIYAVYPRKVGKAVALKAIEKAIVDVAQRNFDTNIERAAEWLRSRVTAYAMSPQGNREDKSFIPYPATWFNGGRYDDDPEEWSHVGASRGSARALEQIGERQDDGFEEVLSRPDPAWAKVGSR